MKRLGFTCGGGVGETNSCSRTKSACFGSGAGGGGGGGGGGGDDSGISYDRPTNLNETIDIVMDLANREVDDAMLGMGFSTDFRREGDGNGR